MQFEKEIIYGQIVGKANNYLIDPRYYARMVKSDKVKRYEREFARQCKIYKGRQIDCPFELIATIYYRDKRFDLDNSFKTLLDCLQYVGAITNDNLCTRIVGDKLIDPQNPRVEFILIPENSTSTTPSLFDDELR